MSFDLLNPLMLLGLAGLALPVIAHLLSKRRFDVVEWGAMQFLELERATRRRIRLEELLLLLIRMGLIALLVFALARPWVAGSWLSGFASTESRDVVLVVDGSYSMGWEGRAVTPHAAAVQLAHEFLDSLKPGDTISLLEARDRVRPVIESPTRDVGRVREELDALPPPAGSARPAAAAAKGVQLLSRTTNMRRDVIVLTDGQARGWSPGDANFWARFDDLRAQPSIAPRVWIANVVEPEDQDRVNFTVERLKLSRELTVPDFPVRITTKVRYTGGDAPVSRRVYLEVDRQRLADETLQVRLVPGGETTVEFEHRFTTPGSHLISVVLDPDPLPGDNRADGAVVVSDALPVLLVDGAPHLDPTQSETFFARTALSATSNPTPWVKAEVVRPEALAPDQTGTAVIMLSNVPQLSEVQAEGLADFVSRGGGLLVALGDQVDAENYHELLFDDANGVLPAKLQAIARDEEAGLQGVRVVDQSLELPWIARFRAANDGGFTDARFSKWWQVTPASAEKHDGEQAASAAIVAARLNTSDPLLVARRFGRGNVLLWTSSLDADWNTLPAKPDYVSLLHELTFYLAATSSRRNVDVGVPLVLAVDPQLPIDEYKFYGPGETELAPDAGGDELRPFVRLGDTRLPGVYRFARDPGDEQGELFVVNFDRGESDLAPLTADEQALISRQGERLQFTTSLNELRQRMLADDARTEFWYLLLLVFIAVLVVEVAMTRRLVQGGHEAVDDRHIDLESSQELHPEARSR